MSHSNVHTPKQGHRKRGEIVWFVVLAREVKYFDLIVQITSRNHGLSITCTLAGILQVEETPGCLTWINHICVVGNSGFAKSSFGFGVKVDASIRSKQVGTVVPRHVIYTPGCRQMQTTDSSTQRKEKGLFHQVPAFSIWKLIQASATRTIILLAAFSFDLISSGRTCCMLVIGQRDGIRGSAKFTVNFEARRVFRHSALEP